MDLKNNVEFNKIQEYFVGLKYLYTFSAMN